MTELCNRHFIKVCFFLVQISADIVRPSNPGRFQTFFSEKGQPFDQEFYLILNVAVGGHFLDGPDPWDQWHYPEAEMWVDWVKFYDLNDIGDLPDYECVANPHATTDELCGATTWACYEQNYAWMGDVCDDSWKKCCQRYQCSHQEVVDQCTRVFAQYDSQVIFFKLKFFLKIANF